MNERAETGFEISCPPSITVGKKKSFAIEGNSDVLNLSLKICLHFCKHPRVNDNSKSWKIDPSILGGKINQNFGNSKTV